MATSFSDKFLRKIKKVDADQIETFLAHVLREKAFLEVVFNSITEGVVVVDGKQKVVFINDAACALLAVDCNDAPGRALDKILRARPFVALMEEFTAHARPIRQREIVLRTPAMRIYDVSVIPVEKEDGKAAHSVWIINDRTDINRAAEEKQRGENIESLAALTAGVAHEIKNPLNSMNIHTQLIERAVREIPRGIMEDTALARVEQSAGVVIDEIHRLARIVDEFIRAVRPVQPALKKTPLNKIIEAIAELIRPECESRGISLALELDPEIPQLLIDAEQIQQALLNIIKNAIEAIDGNGGEITISTSLKSDHALIAVEDNGCGIPEADRLRIFEPYHSTKFSGTGLGLMMVYRIVKAHHGAIALRSEEGVGTIFSVALPLDERPVRLLEAQIEPPLSRLDRAS